MIALRKARLRDAFKLDKVKLAAFKEKRKLYKDSPIDPDSEPFIEFIRSLFDSKSDYRAILYKEKTEEDYRIIGGIRLIKTGESSYCIAPFYIEPCFQGRGIGGKVLERVLSDYPKKTVFTLTATLEDEGVVRFYERHSFVFNGDKAEITEGATLGVFVRK